MDSDNYFSNIKRFNDVIASQSAYLNQVSSQFQENQRYEKNHSGNIFDSLIEYITDFQNKLDSEHEIGMFLSSFGQSILMNVVSISYDEPYLIMFEGYVNGERSKLIQHHSQLNFLLVAQKRADESKPARRIGFNSLDSDK